MSFILLGILNSQVTASAAGGYDLLETTLISTNTASVTFSSLGSYSDYKHLQIRLTARTDRAAILDQLAIRFNGDTASNYPSHDLYGQATAVSSISNGKNDRIYAPVISAATDTASVFGAAVVDVLDFSSANKNTTTRSLGGNMGTTGSRYIHLSSGLWLNTAAVTSVTFFPAFGTNFVANSRFSLYGVK